MKREQEVIDPYRELTSPKRLPLYAFFAGSAISYVGDILTLLAIPWFVLQTTGSVTLTGITAFFSTLPAVFSAFFGSSLVDRLGYKRTSVFGDIASRSIQRLSPILFSRTRFIHISIPAFLTSPVALLRLDETNSGR